MAFMDRFSFLFTYLLTYSFSIYKWLTRLLFGTCELERICSTTTSAGSQKQQQQEQHTIDMTLNFEKAFSHSKQLSSLKQTIPGTQKHPASSSILSMDYCDEEKDTDTVVNEILKIKKGKSMEQDPELRKKPWVINMTKCVRQMIVANRALKHLDDVRSIAVEKDNAQHDKLLDDLWRSIFPQIPKLKRVTDEWQMLGFQGTDPVTDFRSTGLLGLTNLLYFAQQHASIARSILVESRCSATMQELELDNKWYGFAISGINFTADLFHMASRHNTLFRKRMYTCNSKEDVLRVFNETYVKFFIIFHEYWKREQATILEFNQTKDKLVKTFFAL